MSQLLCQREERLDRSHSISWKQMKNLIRMRCFLPNPRINESRPTLSILAKTSATRQVDSLAPFSTLRNLQKIKKRKFWVLKTLLTCGPWPMKTSKLAATNTRCLVRSRRSPLNRTESTTFCQHSSWLHNSHRLTCTNLPWATIIQLDHIQKTLKAILYYLVNSQNFYYEIKHLEAMSIFWEGTKAITMMPLSTTTTVLSATKELTKMKEVKWLLVAS